MEVGEFKCMKWSPVSRCPVDLNCAIHDPISQQVGGRQFLGKQLFHKLAPG